MRQNESIEGVSVRDANGNEIGKSRVAAVKGINICFIFIFSTIFIFTKQNFLGQAAVVFSRVLMAAPGMLLLPIIMEKLETYPWFKRMSVLHAPFQTVAVGGL